MVLKIEKQKSIIMMENYYLKVNIYVEKNGMEKDIIKIVI